MHFLDFEKSFIDLEAKIKDLSLDNIELYENNLDTNKKTPWK